MDGQEVPRCPHQRVLDTHGHPHPERGQSNGFQHGATAATGQEGGGDPGAQRHRQLGQGQEKLNKNPHGSAEMTALGCSGH